VSFDTSSDPWLAPFGKHIRRVGRVGSFASVSRQADSELGKIWKKLDLDCGFPSIMVINFRQGLSICKSLGWKRDQMEQVGFFQSLIIRRKKCCQLREPGLEM
jgi:hypothetical protein